MRIGYIESTRDKTGAQHAGVGPKGSLTEGAKWDEGWKKRWIVKIWDRSVMGGGR